jgi:hypothetical protein
MPEASGLHDRRRQKMSALSKTLTAAVATATLAVGMAGTASAQSWGNGHDRGYDRNYDRGDTYGYGEFRGGGGQSFAVDQCRRAVTDAAMRNSTNAKVTDIRWVRPTGDGFRVGGQVAVYRWGGYGRASYERVSFSCRTDRGRIADVNIGGRGW